MSEEISIAGLVKPKLSRGLAALKESESAIDDAACPAFGYLRGMNKRAFAVEFRYLNGNSDWFSYSLLGSWRFNPSVGLLLKFSGGDLLTYVLIRGSNLDAMLPDRDINLTDQGFQRHRINFVREMDEAELRKAGEREPTIDRIEVAEFESNQEAEKWLKSVAPVFVREKSSANEG
jgi:hypothetical protein